MLGKVKLDGINNPPTPLDPKTATTYGPAEQPPKSYTLALPESHPSYGVLRRTLQNATPQTKLKAVRAFMPILSYLASRDLNARYNEFIPPINPQPTSPKDMALAAGMAASTFGAAAAATHGFINMDDKETLKKDVAVAAGCTGLGVLLYKANKGFIESGRYGGFKHPKLHMGMHLLTAAAPVGVYQLWKLRNQQTPNADKGYWEQKKKELRDLI